MKIANFYVAFVGLSLLSSVCYGYVNSEELENKLNTCRKEYKDLVSRTNAELEKLKTKAPENFPSIYKKKQDELKQKANSCKQIKSDLTYIKSFEQRTALIRQAQPSQKTGPKLRCFQLGQNWSEFENCARAIGYGAEITETKDKTVVFKVADGSVLARLDNNHYINKFEFNGGAFWGATAFDQHFLQAFVNNYNIPELIPDQYYNPVTSQIFNIPPIPYYKGNIQGGTIEIIPSALRIIVEKTSGSSGYKF